MIPDRSVFLRSSMGRSLTATVESMTSDIWDMREHASDAVDVDDAGDASHVGNGEVEVVEGICCCIMHELMQENKASQDQVLFV
jgi:hypothetical protein